MPRLQTSWLLWAFGLLAIAQSILVFLYSVNVPYSDDWVFVAWFKDGDTFQWPWRAHGHHRVFWTYLQFAILMFFSGWHIPTHLLITQLLLAATVWSQLVVTDRKTPGYLLCLLALFSANMSSPYLWAIANHFIYFAFFSTWAVHWTFRENPRPWAGSLAGIAALLSSGVGPGIVGAISLIAALRWDRARWRSQWKPVLVLFLAGVAWALTRPTLETVHDPSLTWPLEFDFWKKIAGTVSYGFIGVWRPDEISLLGIVSAGFIFFITLVPFFRYRSESPSLAAQHLCFFFAAALIALGRGHLEDQWSARYFLIGAFLFASSLLMISTSRLVSWSIAVCLGAMLVASGGFSYTTYWGLYSNKYEARRRLQACYRREASNTELHSHWKVPCGTEVIRYFHLEAAKKKRLSFLMDLSQPSLDRANQTRIERPSSEKPRE